jgi:hypothetical protein
MLPSLLPSFSRRRHRPSGACTPVFVWLTRRRPRVEASGSRVDGLLHDDGDEAIVVIPRHTSSVAASLFVVHHPRHHHPCRPRPLLHHCCRRSPTTLVTIFLSLTAVDEQSQRRLSLGSKVTPAKKENMRRRSNSPKCVSWASPSEVSSKKIRNDTQELVRSKNMDRRRALVPSH